jgi:hypothetical protein
MGGTVMKHRWRIIWLAGVFASDGLAAYGCERPG